MTRTLGWMACAAAGLMLAVHAKDSRADLALQAAIKKETVDGDLKAAIKQYAEIETKYKSDRAVVAMALVRMAEAYRKMGASESRRIYERVMSGYGDQKEAVSIARSRLGGNESATLTTGDRSIWQGTNVDLFGRISPGGGSITFVDWWFNGSLMVRDLATGSDHVLRAAPKFVENAGYSAFSPDGKRLAYQWSDQNRRPSFHIAEFLGTKLGESRQVFVAPEDVRFLMAFDWSPDGKWIASAVRRKDGTGQIALISVPAGEFRVLASMDWNTPDRIAFSPDSKYIAYDIPGDPANSQRDIQVLAIDGSSNTAAVVHPAHETLLGWAPATSHLLFGSDRTGSTGIWALRFANGQMRGAPELLRADIGSTATSLGLTDSGSLALYKHVSTRDVRIARIDLAEGRLLDAPSPFPRGFLNGSQNPGWSPDGQYLAYAAFGEDLAIRSVASGHVRKLPRSLLHFSAPQWSPDGRSLVVGGRDTKGRDGVFRIDVTSGAASPVVYTTNVHPSPRWSPDGAKIYYVNRHDSAIHEKDLATGSDRQVIRHAGLWREVNLSPDGRSLAVQIEDAAAKTSRLWIAPVAGGEPRELMRLAPGENWGPMGTTAWTPDGKAILKLKRTPSSEQLLLISTSTGAARHVAVDPAIWNGSLGGLDKGFALAPDGARIAFLMGKSAAEVWAIENLVGQLK